MPSTKLVKVFYCCSDSNQDEDMRQQLEEHLSSLKRQRVITEWHSGMISPGKEWESETDKNLKTADIILLLISSKFTASDYHWEVLAKQAMEQHRNKTSRVVVILLRPVVDYWKIAFPKVKVLPDEGRPVTEWKPYDKAFKNIAEGIREVAEELTDSNFHIKKSCRLIKTIVILVAKAAWKTFIDMAKIFLPLFKSSRLRRRNRVSNISIRPVILLVGGGILMLVISRALNILEIPSLEPNSTLSSTEKANSTGWIWIGMINNTSDSLSVGERLLQPSKTNKLFPPRIYPFVVPLPGAIVTVKYKVNLRKEKSSSSKLLDELQPGEKLVILKVEPIAKANHNLPYIKLMAQVRKCNQTCRN